VELLKSLGRERYGKGTHLIKIEKLAMELLLLLVSRRESLVSREEIAERLWGKDLSLRSRNPKLSMTAPGRLIAVSVTEL